MQHQHFHAYLDVLDRRLAAARSGSLSPLWRYEDEVHRPNPIFALSPATGAAHVYAVKTMSRECVMHSEAIDFIPDRMSLAYCARLDVAAVPRQDWEPFSARGDWRRALDSWYECALRVHQHRVDGVQLLTHDDPEWARARLAENRDLLDASYRAGLAEGMGTDNGWREWLAERTCYWRDEKRATSIRLVLLDFETPEGTTPTETNSAEYNRDPYRVAPAPVTSLESLDVALPAYWTQPSTERHGSCQNPRNAPNV